MTQLQPTPTADSLTRRFADFATLGEALDYAALGQRGFNFHDPRGTLTRVYPFSELREDSLTMARRLVAHGVKDGEAARLVQRALQLAPNHPKALAIAGPKRSPLLPDVPTMKEAGVDGVEVQQWYAIFAPAKTPKDVVAKLNKSINGVLADKDVIKRMEDHGADVETSTPEQLGSLVKTELAKWKNVVVKAKITMD